ncbi:strigolactone esterase D14-like [Actinidia eriantha]|uniref:strigolactone esterase D14-like n=1 Tax=Actinidia eriantha TaxID=165200 RepID=UPI002587A11C|nr:strigolactone esterase D14-like [Actinidia eriantha]
MVMVGKGLSLSIAMNARTIGEGTETVVLAHGFGADQSVWDKIVPFLTQRCRVVLFDWAFSGSVKDPTLFDPVKYSTFDAFADDLISLLDEMNLKSVFFVGHSMSGMIGCVASTKRPELFNRLILVGASPRYINLEDYEGGFEITEVDQLLSSIESNFHQWASSFASLVVDPNDPISVDKFKNCLQRMRPEVALSVAKLIFHSDKRDTLEKVVIPCTIIQTINDVAVPVSVGDYMMKRIKAKSTVEIIEVDGHFPQLTAHVQFLEVLGGVLPFDL